MSVTDFGRISGERVHNSHHQRYRSCDRCGKNVVQDRKRKDGLVLCIDCCGDTWYIKAAGRTVKT